MLMVKLIWNIISHEEWFMSYQRIHKIFCFIHTLMHIKIYNYVYWNSYTEYVNDFRYFNIKFNTNIYNTVPVYTLFHIILPTQQVQDTNFQFFFNIYFYAFREWFLKVFLNSLERYIVQMQFAPFSSFYQWIKKTKTKFFNAIF